MARGLNAAAGPHGSQAFQDVDREAHIQMSIRNVRLLGVFAAMAVLTVFAASPAMAIPASNNVRRIVTAAGSDTTQDVVAALLARQNGNFAANANPGDSRTRDNFVNLTPVPVAPGFSVPGDVNCGRRIYTPGGNADADPRTVDPVNGSTSGRNALAASAGSAASSAGCVDIARSSSGPSSSDPVTFEYYAYARDALSWSAVPGGQAPADLTRQQLIDIYTCVITDWSDPRLPADAGSGQIIRVLPQTGSGTLSFFLTSILQNAPIPPSSAGCPLVQNPTVQENSGAAIVANVPASDLDRVISPYSVAQWVSQANGAVDDIRAGFTIRNINGVDPVIEGPPAAPNTAVINDGSFIGSRLVYNVLDTRSPAYTDALRAVGFDGAGPSVLCSGGYSAILLEYGFTPLPTVGGNACLLF